MNRMSRIVYDTAAMQVIALFAQLTRAELKDCIISERQVVFVVEPGEMGKAIGPKGANVRRLEHKLQRRVKIVEFSHEPATFIKNLVYPLDVKNIAERDGVYVIAPADLKTRGLLIGRNAQNLRQLEGIVQRYFPIKEIKVV